MTFGLGRSFQMSVIVAFNTANLVARFSGYNLSNWGDEQKKTVAKTDEKEFAAICREIAMAGFTYVELWVAHIDPSGMTDARAANYRAILRECGLTPVALAGALNDANADVCKKLNIPACCGGYWGSDHATVVRLTWSTGIRFNYENHAEKSVEEIRKQIHYGADGLAANVDTGWFATQNIPAPAAIAELGTLVRHVHLKDIDTIGGHGSVRLGTGVVDIPGCIRALKSIGYGGVLSWEDEPGARNPMDIAAEMRVYIQSLWNSRE
jgi:L-ribulose-5-phosphate 3-epimerase